MRSNPQHLISRVLGDRGANRVPQTVVCAMLAWALLPINPYGYYILLKWVVCGVFAYLAVAALRRQREGWCWLLGITAALYNPVIQVHLGRPVWSIVNIVTIGIAVSSIRALKDGPPSAA